MLVQPHDTLEKLQQQQNQTQNPATVLKIRAICLAKKSWTAPQIAEALGKSRRTIQRWIQLYNQHGIDGLKDHRGGNNHYLCEQQEKQLQVMLDQLAKDPQSGVRHAGELIPLIEMHFGVTYSLSGLYDLLRRLNYSWLMPRQSHEKNDPAKMEAFKKTSIKTSKRSPKSILIEE